MALFSRCMATCAMLILLVGCASKPAIPFDRSSSNSVKTIGLLTPDLPGEPRAVLASSVGESFGLIGLLIDAGMESNRDGSLSDIMRSQQFVADKTFTDRLVTSLKSRGYEVELIPVSRAERGKFLTTYPTGSNKVDAYLDVIAVNYGYVAAGISGNTPYRPFFYTQCKLVRASDNSILMEDAVNYNPIETAGRDNEHVTISPDTTYTFKTFSDLEADPTKAVKGLDIAFAQTTDAIGQLLR